MNRIPRSLRAALAGTAAVSLLAAGVALLSAAPAQAASASVLTLQAVYPDDLSASAGTCQIYRAVPTDFKGDPVTDTETVRIELNEDPSSSTQDVDFCTPPAAPDGKTGGVRPTTAVYGDQELEYTPGRSVSTSAGDGGAGGTPDHPSMTPGPSSPTNFNLPGYDYAEVQYVAGGFVEFGVAALVPGKITINAYIDRTTDLNAKNGPLSVTITDGGKPQTSQAYDAVRALNPERTSYAAVQNPSSPALINLLLTNKDSDTVFDVTPNFRVQNGPNASSSIRSCSASTDFGNSQCSYLGVQPGTDTLMLWVNHSAAPNSIATSGPDPGEPTELITVVTYAQPAAAGTAKTIDLLPNSPTTQDAGTTKTFTAVVTDASGAPVHGAQVTFTETGPGRLSGGTSSDGVTSTLVVTTNPDGRISVSNVTLAGESGTQTVTARLSGASLCGSGGTCQDTTTNTIAAAPSPNPSASRSASATPSATATATVSPSRSADTCRTATVSVNTPTVNATGLASVTVRGAGPSTRVELQGYSQNHYGTANFDNDPTPVDRSGVTDANGSVTFNDLRPGSNTRLRARQVNCAYGGSAVINVRTQLSLQVTRVGARQYRFGVDSIPARPGGLIVSIYRITGTSCAAGVEPRNCPGEVFVGQTRVSAVNGEGAVTFTFDRTYPAREQFVLKTGQDAQNFPGRSNVRDLAIF